MSLNFQHLTDAQRAALGAAYKGGYSAEEQNCISHHSNTINGVQVVVLSVWAGRSEDALHHGNDSWQMITIGTSTGFRAVVYEKFKNKSPERGAWCSVYYSTDGKNQELTVSTTQGGGYKKVFSYNELGIPEKEEEHPPTENQQDIPNEPSWLEESGENDPYSR